MLRGGEEEGRFGPWWGRLEWRSLSGEEAEPKDETKEGNQAKAEDGSEAEWCGGTRRDEAFILILLHALLS